MQCCHIFGFLFLLLPASNSVFAEGSDYPRSFFFRQPEWDAVANMDYEEWAEKYAGRNGIIGKVLNEDLMKHEEQNPAYFSLFKMDYPDQLALVHFDGLARSPYYDTEGFFAGHWLYNEAAVILSDVPVQTNDTVISVSDTTWFQTGIGRTGDRNVDIVLCQYANGVAVWETAEQVQLLSVDTNDNTITVRRGCFGTSPGAYPATVSKAAAHMVDGPWGGNAPLLWKYNFSTRCPTDSYGRNCADALVDDFAEKFLSDDGVLKDLDGIEFDVALSIEKGDMDGDGVVEDGIIGGINTYGAGLVEFYKKLRTALGDEYLIMADGGTLWKQRCFGGVLNGVESEGWTYPFDSTFDGWSAAYNFHRFWKREARSPKLSYINTRYVYEHSFATYRLVMAAAQFMDSGLAYKSSETDMPYPEPGEEIGHWDEMVMGAQYQQNHWLGQPESPAIHLATQTVNLVSGSLSTVVSNGNQVLTTAFNCPGSNLVVVVRVAGEPLDGYPAEYARLMKAYIDRLPLSGPSVHTVPMSWVNTNEFESIFYYRDVTNSNVSLTIEIEGTNAVTISSLAAHAAPDAVYRVFENGVVLANPSWESVEFELPVLTPGRTYKRLRAFSMQDTNVNTGASIGSNHTLGPLDGRFLIRGDVLEDLVQDSFSGTTLDGNWTVDLNAISTVSDDLLTLRNGGLNTGRRAFVRRNTDSTGSLWRDSEKVFNCYDHGLTMKLDIADLGGTPDAGKRISYFMGICYDPTGNLMHINGASNGLFFAVQQRADSAGVLSWRFVTSETIDGVSTVQLLGNLSGPPTGVEAILNGNDWVIDLDGATFTDGSFAGASLATGSFATAQESDFADFYFSTGVTHEGPAVVAGEMSIRNISITTTPWK